MYKVFLNDRIIHIGDFRNITLNKPTEFEEKLETPEEVKKWFHKFETGKENDVYLKQSVPKYFFEKVFQKAFLKIKAAGGVVVRKQKILFIYRNKVWDLPKGKIDKGETIDEAALREVEEECGITGHRIVKQLPSTYHLYQSMYKKTKGEWIFKETFWFEMEYTGEANGVPQLEEDITQLKWISGNDLNLILTNTYSNLIPIIESYRC